MLAATGERCDIIVFSRLKPFGPSGGLDGDCRRSGQERVTVVKLREELSTIVQIPKAPQGFLQTRLNRDICLRAAVWKDQNLRFGQVQLQVSFRYPC